MVWHDNTICLAGAAIPREDRVVGRGGFSRCPACAKM